MALNKLETNAHKTLKLKFIKFTFKFNKIKKINAFIKSIQFCSRLKKGKASFKTCLFSLQQGNAQSFCDPDPIAGGC